MSYTVAALILLGFASLYPFLSFGTAGVESVMTLWQTSLALWNYGMEPLAVMVALFIQLLPLAVLVLLCALCLPLMLGRNAPWLHFAAHSIHVMQNWVMVEVFIIGVIVSLVKIAAMATVTLGLSFWSYAAFSVCFTLATATLDPYQVWEQIEALEQKA